MIKKSFLILILLSSNLFANHFFENGSPKLGIINKYNGLDNTSISSMVQDKNDIVWLGAQGGLYRYDGVSFKYFGNDPYDENSLSNDLIQTMEYDRENHRLLIGTYSGLSIFDIKTNTFKNFLAHEDGGLSNSIVTSITTDNKGNIWIGTLDGLNILNELTGNISRIKTLDKAIRSLYKDEKENIWVGSYGGLEVFNENLKSKEVKLSTSSTFIMDIKPNNAKELIIGVWGTGVVFLNIETLESRTMETKDNRVYCVYKTSDETVWAGTWGGGLWALNPNGKETYLNDTLVNQVVYSFMEDRAGQLWVGTNGGGINIISPRKIDYTYIISDNENVKTIPEGKITSIFRDNKNNLWIGIYGKGLFLYVEKTKTAILYPTGNDIINHMSQDSLGNLWVSTNLGLVRINVIEKSFTPWNSIYPEIPLPNEVVSHTYESKNDDFWISTYGSGVFRVSKSRDSIVNYSKGKENSISDNTVYSSIENNNGIWFATNKGLNRFILETQEFHNYYHIPNDRSSIGINNIRAMFVDSSQNLWVGTYGGGVSRYISEDDNFKTFTSHEGLSSNTIITMIEGEDNSLWIVTKSGVDLIPMPYNDVYNLGRDYGLNDIVFNSGIYKEENGDLLLGGSNGISKISSVKNLTNPNPPNLILNSVKLFGKEIKLDPDETIIVSHDQKHLEFNFTGIEFGDPLNVSYSFMMVGYDKNWIDAGKRNYASYTSLPPGKYLFRVTAYNNSMVRSPKDIEIPINVKKAWYRNNLSFLVYAIFISVVLYLIINLRYSSKLRTKNTELDKLNSKLKELTIKDSLTNCFNRLYFEKNYIKEFHRARRANQPLAILFIDVDNFKEINDTLGHEIGDNVLIGVAEALNNAVQRETDFVARYGGDEFIAVLFNTNSQGVELVLKRIKSGLEAINNIDKKITISVGVHVGIPDSHTNSRMMLIEADKALYKAKKNGKDRLEYSINSF